LYGPAPTPQQITAIISPNLFWVCVVFGLLLSGAALSKRLNSATRAAFFCLGQVVILTAPLALVLPDVVFGDFPTIDKAGSFFYYQSGVHQHFLFHPIAALNDCGVQLIGVHMGHLWISEFFDLFLQDYGAFNAQALLYPALAWWCAALFFQEISGKWINAIVLGLPFGLGLHVYRDLNWYTIEKAAIFLLPLFAWTFYRVFSAHKRGGHQALRNAKRWTALAFALAAFVNWYLALVIGVGAALTVVLSRSKTLFRALALCVLVFLPLLLLQLALVAKGSPGSPDAFLNQRAALDHFSLAPLRWNRLELVNALNPAALLLVFWALLRTPRDGIDKVLLGVALGLFVFSLGPNLSNEIRNPVYMLAWSVVPGFWRVAKPEVFFYGTWLCLLAVTARAWSARSLAWAYPFMVIGWIFWVRSHPAYPGFSEFVDLVPVLCENTP
jgi:hypothetical protein